MQRRDRRLRNLNIDMNDKDIGACLIHEFLTNMVDEPYRVYLDLTEGEFKNLQQKWIKTRDSLLKKVKMRSSLLAVTEQAEYCLTPREEEPEDVDDNNTSIIIDKPSLTQPTHEEISDNKGANKKEPNNKNNQT